jgi:hypothetical protein
MVGQITGLPSLYIIRECKGIKFISHFSFSAQNRQSFFSLTSNVRRLDQCKIFLFSTERTKCLFFSYVLFLHVTYVLGASDIRFIILCVFSSKKNKLFSNLIMEETTTEPLSDTASSASVTQKPIEVITVCKICGAPALHSYVGVIVCCSCKMFFKRNADAKKV